MPLKVLLSVSRPPEAGSARIRLVDAGRLRVSEWMFCLIISMIDREPAVAGLQEVVEYVSLS